MYSEKNYHTITISKPVFFGSLILVGLICVSLVVAIAVVATVRPEAAPTTRAEKVETSNSSPEQKATVMSPEKLQEFVDRQQAEAEANGRGEEVIDYGFTTRGQHALRMIALEEQQEARRDVRRRGTASPFKGVSANVPLKKGGLFSPKRVNLAPHYRGKVGSVSFTVNSGGGYARSSKPAHVFVTKDGVTFYVRADQWDHNAAVGVVNKYAGYYYAIPHKTRRYTKTILINGGRAGWIGGYGRTSIFTGTLSRHIDVGMLHEIGHNLYTQKGVSAIGIDKKKITTYGSSNNELTPEVLVAAWAVTHKRWSSQNIARAKQLVPNGIKRLAPYCV